MANSLVCVYIVRARINDVPQLNFTKTGVSVWPFMGVQCVLLTLHTNTGRWPFTANTQQFVLVFKMRTIIIWWCKVPAVKTSLKRGHFCSQTLPSPVLQRSISIENSFLEEWGSLTYDGTFVCPLSQRFSRRRCFTVYHLRCLPTVQLTKCIYIYCPLKRYF